MSSNNRPPLAIAWLGVAAVLFITAWFGWKALGEAKPDAGNGAAPPARPPSTVIVKPAEERQTVEYLAVTGELRAARRADVASRESAAVESLETDEGDLVEAGTVIATLDSRRLDAQIQEAAAALTAAKAELTQRQAERERATRDEEMMRGLWDQRAVAEREFLDSVREMKVAAARENAAAEAIQVAEKRAELLDVRRADLQVKAPFTGRVVALHTEIGEWVNEGDPVITLISTGEVEAWLQLPERKAALLKTTSPESVRLRIPGHSDAIRADRISLVPDVEGRSRRFNLIAHITDADNTLTPGSSVDASVPLGVPGPKLAVSADAVLSSYSGTHVFVPDDSGDGPPVAKQVSVDVLFERDGESYLANGALKPGDRVIVEGNERLFPNTPLDPQPWSETRGAGSETAETVEP